MIVYYKNEELIRGENLSEMFLKEIYERIEDFDESKIHIEYSKKELSKLRDEMLQKGTISKDGKMWFNLDSAQMFISGLQTLEEGEVYPWRNAQREIVLLSYEEAKTYAKEIRMTLQKFYGLEA